MVDSPPSLPNAASGTHDANAVMTSGRSSPGDLWKIVGDGAKAAMDRRANARVGEGSAPTAAG